MKIPQHHDNAMAFVQLSLMTHPRHLVVFDLDGTLTSGDSYLAYLIGFVVRHPSRLVRLLHLPWPLLRFSMGLIDNVSLKRHFLRACLGGIHCLELQRWTQTFLDRLVSQGLSRDGLVALERHRRDGDMLILLSASFDFYVEELGRRLRFDHVLCTKAAWNGDYLSGDLAGPNRYGLEKLRCLAEMKTQVGEMPVIAYADHESDIPFLQFVDKGMLINGTANARRIAERRGIPCS